VQVVVAVVPPDVTCAGLLANAPATPAAANRAVAAKIMISFRRLMGDAPLCRTLSSRQVSASEARIVTPFHRPVRGALARVIAS